MVKLLVAEDNPPVCDLLTRRLIGEGFEVIAATNGVQAVTLARIELPALILLDIGLPLLDGWEVARRLRLLPATRATPIILMSGSSPADLDERLAAVGCDAYVPKPLNIPELVATIHWLSSTPHPASPQAAPAAVIADASPGAR